MPYDRWDGNLYVDETMDKDSVLSVSVESIIWIAAGIGVSKYIPYKGYRTKLLEWCGVAYCSESHSSGSAAWRTLSKMTCDCVIKYFFEMRADNVYVCSQIGKYIKNDIGHITRSSGRIPQLKKLEKSIVPLERRKSIHDKSLIEPYYCKQDVGKKLRNMVELRIGPNAMKRMLEGELYDIKNSVVLNPL